MKIILLGDTHFGIKNFSLDYFNNQKKFFEKQLFPYMNKNNIQNIYQLGDLFDNRITIDINYINTLYQFFISNKDIKWTTILGNHDIYYKNTRNINLTQLFSKLVTNIQYIDEPTIINNIGFQPWVIGDTLLEDCEVLLGHFEINGFKMAMGMEDEHSTLTTNSFKKYKRVFSGHYHSIQQKGNITYLGSPYELSWGETDTEHGFWVYDLDLDELEFIPNNESKRHIKLTLDGEQYSIECSGKKLILSTIMIKETLNDLKRDEVKIIVNDIESEKLIPVIKEVLTEAVIQDNIEQEVKDVYVCETSEQFINDYIQTNYVDLYEEYKELLREV